MKIHMRSGAGRGSTKLSAFDSALISAGVANFNLIRLSSIIPAEAVVLNKQNPDEDFPEPGAWGDRLYVVMAEMRIDIVGDEAWAGIGWVQDRISGRGLFVEHEGESEQGVSGEIVRSLKQLQSSRGLDFGNINILTKGVVCVDIPVASVVLAVFKSSPWT